IYACVACLSILYLTCRSCFFDDHAPTNNYTLSLHDALPIFPAPGAGRRSCTFSEVDGGQLRVFQDAGRIAAGQQLALVQEGEARSEEHTSELQSREKLVCRLLLEKKKMLIHGSRMERERP